MLLFEDRPSVLAARITTSLDALAYVLAMAEALAIQAAHGDDWVTDVALRDVTAVATVQRDHVRASYVHFGSPLQFVLDVPPLVLTSVPGLILLRFAILKIWTLPLDVRTARVDAQIALAQAEAEYDHVVARLNDFGPSPRPRRPLSSLTKSTTRHPTALDELDALSFAVHRPLDGRARRNLRAGPSAAVLFDGAATLDWWDA